MVGTVFSLIPPVLALVLCFMTRNTIISMFAAIVVGSIMVNGLNFIPPIVDNYMVNGIKGNTSVICGLLLLGIMLAFIKRAGGFKGFAAFCQRKLDSERKTLASTFWFSCLLFISGYLANLSLPRIMRVPARENKFPIVKVPIVITSVCSALSTMTPVTMYILVFSGMIVSSVEGYNGMEVYMSGVPFMFYPIISLVFAFLFAYGLIPAIGPLRALDKKVKAGELDIYGRPIAADGEEQQVDLNMFGGDEIASDVWALFAPIIGMIAAIVLLSIVQGSIVVNPSFLVGAVVAVIYAMVKKRVSFKQLGGVIVDGVRDQAGLLILLVCAYAFGNTVAAMGFNAFVVGAMSDTLAPQLVPVIAFLVCCVISYGTGSLSAAAAIILPMAIPLALATGAPIPLMVGACVSGSHFGDLSSPVSDNIIMPSEAAGISAVETAKILLPYRLIKVVLVCAAFLVAGFVII